MQKCCTSLDDKSYRSLKWALQYRNSEKKHPWIYFIILQMLKQVHCRQQGIYVLNVSGIIAPSNGYFLDKLKGNGTPTLCDIHPFKINKENDFS